MKIVKHCFYQIYSIISTINVVKYKNNLAKYTKNTGFLFSTLFFEGVRFQISRYAGRYYDWCVDRTKSCFEPNIDHIRSPRTR